MVAPREVNLTTTTTTTLNDLNGRTFTHPTTDHDLLSEFSLDEISKSLSLQTAIAAGDVVLRDEDGVLIPKVELLNVLHNFYATTNPTVNDDKDDGYTTGSYWLNRSTDALYFCVDNTVGAAIWERISTTNSLLGSPSFSGSFFDSSTPYLEYSSVNWQIAMQFPFEGTNLITLQKVVIIASRNGTTGTSEFRLWDVTNSLEIAYIPWTLSAQAIYDDVTLTNLPATRAIFEAQVKKDTTQASKSRLHSLMVY